MKKIEWQCYFFIVEKYYRKNVTFDCDEKTLYHSITQLLKFIKIFHDVKIISFNLRTIDKT